MTTIKDTGLVPILGASLVTKRIIVANVPTQPFIYMIKAYKVIFLDAL